MPFDQLESVFAALPHGVIACDRAGTICRVNPAALKLFELPSEAACRGQSSQQFLQTYMSREATPPTQILRPWLLRLISDAEGTGNAPETILAVQMPSGRKAYLGRFCSPVLDARKQEVGAVSIFHDLTPRYHKALHLQQVHEAVQTLHEAITQLPEEVCEPFFEESPLLSPPVLWIAQHLVDLIRHVLSCWSVGLLALGPAEHLYYVTGSGCTEALERLFQEKGGWFLFSDVLEEGARRRLFANQEVILSADRLHLPAAFQADFGQENLLLIPLPVERRFAGGLVIVKAGSESRFTPEEIDLVNIVVAQALLVIEYLGCLQKQVQQDLKIQVMQNMHHLGTDFLTLAGHELRTPLTGIKGNLQLAQRRLETVKRRMAKGAEHTNADLEQAQRPLTSATRSVQLQERMIQNMLDHARLQANQLALHLTPCDLCAIVRDAVAGQRRSAPGRRIVLETAPAARSVLVLADAERITQVLNTYLTNALQQTPAERPVTVQVNVEDTLARVSVQDEGPGIPPEEQTHLWERFYRAKGSAVQQELDLSLGLGFYLCKELIAHQKGNVGVQSPPGHGAKFWFTIPLASSHSHTKEAPAAKSSQRKEEGKRDDASQ